MSWRRVSVVTGVTLVLAGLGFMAYVVWELYGTNVVSHRAQRHAVAELREEWSEPASSADGDVRASGAYALVRIPRFGAGYVQPLFETTEQRVLRKGFGHYANTADVGEAGNFALAAHRRTRGEPLRHLPELRVGDEVIVETRDTTYTYVIDTDPNKLVLKFTAGWVLKRFPTNPDPGGPTPDPAVSDRLITLTTCAYLFHSDKRMVAFGHLRSAVARS